MDKDQIYLYVGIGLLAVAALIFIIVICIAVSDSKKKKKSKKEQAAPVYQQPVQPTQPEMPVYQQPVQPVQPVQPEMPVYQQPVQPVQPVQPEMPVYQQPVQPEEDATVFLGAETQQPAPAPVVHVVTLKDKYNPAVAFQTRFTENSVIGRNAEECNIVLVNEEAVSRKHCKLEVQNETVVVEDLGSSNGTYLNENRVEMAMPIHTGDVLKIGRSEFILEVQ